MYHGFNEKELLDKVINFVLTTDYGWSNKPSCGDKCVFCNNYVSLMAFTRHGITMEIFSKKDYDRVAPIVRIIQRALSFAFCPDCLYCLRILPSPEKIEKLRYLILVEMGRVSK